MERGSIKSILNDPDLTFEVKKGLAIGAASGMLVILPFQRRILTSKIENTCTASMCFTET